MDSRRESPVKLTMSQDKARFKLEERIQKGANLKKIQINSWAELKSVENSYQKWHDFNKDLLLTICTNSKFADEYSPVGSFAFGSLSRHEPYLGEEVQDLYRRIDRKINRLESIVERLKLFSSDLTDSAQIPSSSSIRQLIEDSLSDNDLINLCQDKFPKVYNQLTTGQTKSQRIGSLIEYVDRQREIPKLLNEIEKINPNAYAEFMNNAD
jgi:Effector-associated domain 7